MAAVAVPKKDRFGNLLDPALPYARGAILSSTEDDFRKLTWAWKIINRRIQEQGAGSVYNFTGLERGFPMDPREIGALDDEVSAAVYWERLRRLALEHLGGAEGVHDVAIFNRLTAATACANLALVKPGETVIGVSASHSHPSVVRGARLAGARFVDTVHVDGFRKAIEAESRISLVALTRLAVTYEILEVDEIKEIIAIAKSRGALVYVDDAGGARVGPAVFGQPKMLELDVDLGSTGLDKYGTYGPRFGLMGGKKELVAKARAKGYEFGMEARPVFYPSVVSTLEKYSPERVRALLLTTKTLEKEVRGRLGERVTSTPTIFQLKGEDTLEIAMERAGLAKPPIVPFEASAGLALILLRRYGIITVHLAGVPPGTSAILFKFVNPDTLARFGGPVKFAEAVDESLSELARVIMSPDEFKSVLFGPAGQA